MSMDGSNTFIALLQSRESPSPGGLAYFTAGISEIHLGWIV